MNKDNTLDTVSRQMKEMKEIEEILSYIDWERERLIKSWGESKLEVILETLREEFNERQVNMENNLRKIHEEE